MKKSEYMLRRKPFMSYATKQFKNNNISLNSLTISKIDNSKTKIKIYLNKGYAIFYLGLYGK